MICCVIGPRTSEFPFKRIIDSPAYTEYLDRLFYKVEGLIRSGYTHFITGITDGADIDFAIIVVELKKINPSITLEVVFPYPPTVPKLNTPYQRYKQYVCKMSNEKTILSGYFHKGYVETKNRYMVDKSDLVLAIYNPENNESYHSAIRYAENEEKEISYLML